MTERVLWRVFPWDRTAREQAPFSPSFVPRPTGRGRFDLPLGTSPTLYLAESPEHAIGESIQPWRGGVITPGHLQRAGLELALVDVTVTGPDGAIADLCDPSILASLPTRPDRVASRHRPMTQPVAREVWEAGYAGLRWWSSFWGDWHTVVLFSARLTQLPRMKFGIPEPLSLDTPAVVEASRLLGIELRD